MMQKMVHIYFKYIQHNAGHVRLTFELIYKYIKIRQLNELNQPF